MSGWGFEFTFRLKRDEVAPVWPVNPLQNLGRYVFQSGNAFGHGHTIPCNGPIATEDPTELVAILFVRDPQLPPLASPHGSVELLQAVGLTSDEYEACRAWNSDSFAEVLGAANPLLVTDLRRHSILADPLVARQVEEGLARDGSSHAALHVDSLRWSEEGGRWIVEMTATGFASLPAYLRGRLGHGQSFSILGRDQIVSWTPGDTDSVTTSEEALLLTLTPESTRAFCRAIAPKRGTYDIEGLNVTFDVRVAQIRTSDGEVVREVG